MSRTSELASVTSPDIDPTLLEQYGCGPIQFTGTDDALYERHLLFDNVVDPARLADARAFRGLARSVRDVLSQRWVLTEETYERENPKRVYYLSMEFLIGRSLANNVTNLLLDPLVDASSSEQKNLDWLELLEQEPDAGLGNGGLGRLAACFLDSMATHATPGDGLRPALRVRHLPAVDRERLAARTAGQLAAPPRPLGGRPAAREGRGQARTARSSCAAARLRADPRPAVHA